MLAMLVLNQSPIDDTLYSFTVNPYALCSENREKSKTLQQLIGELRLWPLAFLI